jgi:hypothetical protein
MIKQGSFNRFSAFLKDNNQILIPDLQRDYCWGDVFSEGQKLSLAHSFTEELLALSKKTQGTENMEISYGIIYTYEYPETFYYLCDGQQRLTTIYLIVGVLNNYLNDSRLKQLLMLNNGQPRLKYEIRNSTDYFIKHLVKDFLNPSAQSNLSDLTKASWFRKEYEDDPSVKSIDAAVKSIQSLIKKEDSQLVADFILNKMGFVYVNLKGNETLTDYSYSQVRSYGEKMYEIVNTSGDPMEPNEHLKASLISKVPNSEQELWTEKWETWQDFFWVHKSKDQESADAGFNEFLDWIKTLKGETKEIDNIIEVEQYFKALFLLFSIQDELTNFRKHKILNIAENLHKKIDTKLVVILPALVYLKNSNSVNFDGQQYVADKSKVDLHTLYRYLRFFSNVSKQTESTVFAAVLDGIIAQGDDITKLLTHSEGLSKILSDEEIYKLELYRQSEESRRIELEDIIWEAEDHEYLKGKIEPVLNWMDIDLKSETNTEFDSAFFLDLYKTYLSLISDENMGKTRLNLLAVCNNWEHFHEGWSQWSAKRYYLGRKDDFSFWHRITAIDEFGVLVKGTLMNQIDEKFLIESIMKNENVEQRKAYRKLKSEATKHWQWNNKFRFFIMDNVLYLTNGVKVGEYTVEIPL